MQRAPFAGAVLAVLVAAASAAGASPRLEYATFTPEAAVMAVGPDGNTYLAGDHGTCGLATDGAFDTCPYLPPNAPSRDEGQVARLDPAGRKLDWLTSFGGASDDDVNAIAVDRHGDVWVAGFTRSTRFPTTPNALRRTKRGLSDAYVSEYDATAGKLLYSTLLGGSGDDDAYGLALDPKGDVYVAGLTASADFPTTGHAFQRRRGDRHYEDAFVTKLSPQGTRVLYSTLLGGSAADVIKSLRTDSAGNAFVAGETESKDFPVTAGAAQRTCGRCTPKAPGYAPSSFVAKLDPAGSRLRYATFVGGRSVERPTAVAVDRKDNAYLTGSTASEDFPTTQGAWSRKLAPLEDSLEGFATKLNATGTRFVYSTFLPGAEPASIAVDPAGAAWLGGWANASFHSAGGALHARPFTNALTGAHGGGFVEKLGPSGTRPDYGTYVGPDPVTAMAVDSGDVFVAGVASCGLPFATTSGAWLRKFTCGAFVDIGAAAKMSTAGFLVELRR